MNAVFAWIKSEWADPSTHAWLVGLGATYVAWGNGTLNNQQAAIAVVTGLLAIIIPTGAAKP